MHGLGKELTAARATSQIREPVFDEPIHHFEITLIVVRSGRDLQVLLAAQRGRKSAASKLRGAAST